MSQLQFNPATGLMAPQTAQVRHKIAEDWIQAFQSEDKPPLNVEDTSPAGQLIDAQTAEVEAKNAQLLYLSSMFNPKVADGRWQDALGHIYFQTRKIDEPTIVTCQLTGRYGTVVPYGALVLSEEGYTLICNKAVAIDENSRAETTFRCSVTGPIAIAPHSVRTIVTTIAGWDTVDNMAAGATGRDMETRAEFEARRAKSVAKNSHGSAIAVYGEVANIDGVIDCQVLENIGPFPVVKYGVEVPGHGIVVCVYGGDEQDIARAIYLKKGGGCDTGGNTRIRYTAIDYHNAEYDYWILRPQTENFYTRITLGNKANITTAMLDAVKAAVHDDFLGASIVSGNPRVGLAQKVYASRFYTSVMAVDGINSLRNIEVAIGGDDAETAVYTDLLTIRGDQEPVMVPENIIFILED